MATYISSFEPFTNSEYSYDLKIEKKGGGYGGYTPQPIKAYLQHYSSRFDIIAQDKQYEQYNNGYFYSTPKGQYIISYKMMVDGKVEERKEVVDFYQNPAPVNEPLSSESFAVKKLRNQVSQYVMNSDDMGLRSIIASKINSMWPTLDKEITVYRGQKDPMRQRINTEPETFFSTSLEKTVASITFTSRNDKCCLFILHLQPGVKYYPVQADLDEMIEHVNNGSLFEAEILVEGNGNFYQNKEKTVPGFHEIPIEELNARGINRGLFGEKIHTKAGKTLEQKSGIFEAYYFPPESRNNVEGGKRKPKRQTRRRKN